MARVVLGVGTSHSPMLAVDAEIWSQRADDDRRKSALVLTDGRTVTFEDLDAEVGGRYGDLATLETFTTQARLAQESLSRLATGIADAELDLLIIAGDDQGELFSHASVPAIAVYTGDEIVTHPKSEVDPDIPEWYRKANDAYLMDHVHRHPAEPKIASEMVSGLMDAGVDVAVASSVPDPRTAGFGHAFGFVIGRLLGLAPVPVIPVLLNTYFPPNVPRPARCHAIGTQLADIIERLPADLRVGVVASGGLTHFVVDEAFDRAVMEALATHDEKTLQQLPPGALRSGNSEILNWVLVGGAVRSLDVDFAEYIPVRRTSAGTGVGLGFMLWK